MYFLELQNKQDIAETIRTIHNLTGLVLLLLKTFVWELLNCSTGWVVTFNYERNTHASSLFLSHETNLTLQEKNSFRYTEWQTYIICDKWNVLWHKNTCSLILLNWKYGFLNSCWTPIFVDLDFELIVIEMQYPLK